MEQPLKYSDLIQADDTINNLIRQLDEANDAYNNLGNSVKAEASRIASAMQTISGATQQGRSATRGYSEDAQKLLKAERDLNFARSETARKIAELKAMKKDEQTITKLTIQLNRASAGSYEALSAQYGLNKIRLNAMTEEYRKNTKEGQKLEAETRDIYDRMSELQKATGKYTLEVGNYEKAVGQLMGTQNRYIQGLQTLNSIFAGGLMNGIKGVGTALAGVGKQMLALMMNPIVAAIAAIAAAFMALSKGISTSEENTRTLARIMAPFERILTEVVDVLQTMAGWLLKGVEGLSNMAMAASRFAERLPIVGKYLKQVNDALDENVRLTREKQELENAERKFQVSNAKMAANIAKFRADAEKTNDPKRRAQLLKMAQSIEEKAMYDELKLAEKDFEIKKALAAQAGNDKKTNDELAQSEANLYRVREQFYQRQIRLNSKLRRAEEQQNKKTGGSTGGEDMDAKRLAAVRQYEDARVEAMDEGFTKERFKILLNYDRQEEDLRAKMKKEVSLRDVYQKQIEALEIQKQQKLATLVEKEAEAQEKALKDAKAKEKARKDAERKAAEEVLRIQSDVINKENEVRNLEIDSMNISENEKTRLRLEAEKERIKKIYDLNVASGKMLTALDKKLFSEQMKALDAEISRNTKHRDIYDMLGLKLDDDKKQAISDTFSFAMEQLSAYMDAWVQAAEAKAQMAQEDVDRAQSTLDAEIEARNQGYASDVEGARKELELAKKTQQSALREQEKAQKAQQALATVQQATNLVSASALIWAQLGFPWAIPALAVMWGSFAMAKIKAAQVTSQGTEQYGEGTVELLEGGSHQSGNDIDLGRKKDGTRRRAEGGEYFAVINKRNSRRYRKEIPDVIRAFNNGTFEQKYGNAYAGGQSVIINEERQSPDLRLLSDDVSAIREQGERRTYTDSNGTHVLYKNLHRLIRS